MKQNSSALGLVQAALFSALIILLAFTPFLGYIPLGFTRATIIHIPVIIGSILLGPKQGAVLGLVFGLTSLVNNTVNPTATSFVFSPFYELGEIHGGMGSLIICLLPRILTGVVPYYVYRGISKVRKNKDPLAALAVAGLSGALTNTLLVMNLIFVFFRDAYASANGVATESVYGFILTIIGINGIPEAIVATILTALIGRILLKANIHKGGAL